MMELPKDYLYRLYRMVRNSFKYISILYHDACFKCELREKGGITRIDTTLGCCGCLCTWGTMTFFFWFHYLIDCYWIKRIGYFSLCVCIHLSGVLYVEVGYDDGQREHRRKILFNIMCLWTSVVLAAYTYVSYLSTIVVFVGICWVIKLLSTVFICILKWGSTV